MMRRQTMGVLLLSAAVGLVTASGHAADDTIPLTAAACAALQGMAIPASAIGLPTGGAIVQSAVQVAASEPRNVNGDFCKVTGVIENAGASTAIFEFEVNLPSAWNGKVLQMGGGGYDGSLVTGLTPFTLEPANLPTPLKQGFVTLGSNGGHKGGPGFDGTFGTDDEALLNYGKQSVKKTHDVAMAIVGKAYGRAASRVYFIGGSQGGHEALDAAARYPADYDGVVANYPAYNITMLHLGSFNVGRALYADAGAGWMDAAHAKLLTDAVYATCDGLDGVKDGIISNVGGCDRAFDPKTLRCPNGAAGDACLSDAQLKAVATIASPYVPGVTIAGMDAFPRWALLEGATFSGLSNFGQVRQPSNPLSGKEPLLYSAGDQTIKFIITRDATFDPMRFDPKAWTKDVARAAAIMDVTDVSLAPFKAKGGKIILTHGTADDLITPHNTEAYYERQVREFGQAGVSSFIRFYEIPGLGHGFGIFNAKFDGLAAIDDWVEHGRAPAGLVAIDGNPGANRTRPMCEWPAWPTFTGAPGTENQAASFTCTK
jgi:feruloyl esterase